MTLLIVTFRILFVFKSFPKAANFALLVHEGTM